MLNFTDFCRKNAKASNASVKVRTGHTFRLEGVVRTATDEALAELAESQIEDVRVKEPKMETADGTVVRNVLVMAPEDLATAIRGVEPEKTKKTKKTKSEERAAADPAVNGEPVQG